MINIAIIGFGLIGSGAADVLAENESVISKKLGNKINVKYILDLRKIENHALSKNQVESFDTIINDPEISLIVEAMVGSHPAFEYTKAALEKGISVVTPNKEIVAKFGAELLAAAAETDARYFFEASVGGGIPIIRPMYNCLAANKINSVSAIINGTTNFILTKMEKDNLSFDESLSLAQANGFAEKDPSSDIDGIDSCRKICILSSLAFGKQLPPEKVYTEGIRNIYLKDIKNAAKCGYKIKLIAKSVSDGDSVNAIVSPMFVHNSCPLYNIEDVFNGIIINGNAIGDVMFYGRGAGQLPTASAIVADIMDAILKTTKNMTWDISDGSYVADYKLEPVRRYIRMDYVNSDPEYAIKSIFKNSEIYRDDGNKEIFFFTKEYSEYQINEKISALSDSGFNVLSKLRVL